VERIAKFTPVEGGPNIEHGVFEIPTFNGFLGNQNFQRFVIGKSNFSYPMTQAFSYKTFDAHAAPRLNDFGMLLISPPGAKRVISPVGNTGGGFGCGRVSRCGKKIEN
jgi:hypothetical protein